MYTRVVKVLSRPHRSDVGGVSMQVDINSSEVHADYIVGLIAIQVATSLRTKLAVSGPILETVSKINVLWAELCDSI